MSITLLTAVPGGGKTSYAVWNVIKKAHEEGKIIYTVGIPKLKIPTIELKYDQVRKWHEIEHNKEGMPELMNIEHGSILVVDEVQKIWPATGSKVTNDIADLSVHRHYGLTFFLITQSPNLIHRNVLSLVDRHLHISNKWSGRKIYEWSEYCRNPNAKNNRDAAITFSYKLPKESFGLYHSATQHVKPVKRAPMAFFVFVLGLMATSAFAYFGYDRIINKAETAKANIQQELPAGAPVELPVNLPTEKPVIQVAEVKNDPFDMRLLNPNIKWESVTSCLKSTNTCVCYGKSAERLVIPKETCELAVVSGWSREKI